MRDILFPFFGKGPVFGGGGGGGGGGGSDSGGGSGNFTVTNPVTGEVSRHSSKASAEAAANSLASSLGTTVSDTTRSAPAASAPSGGGGGGSSLAPTSSPAPAPRPAAPAPIASGGGGSSLAPATSPAPVAAVRPVAAPVVAAPPPPAPAPPPAAPPAPPTGYTSIRDLFDGGGPGQSGPEFGGLLGGISNTLGLTPMDSGDRSGGVYQGPNVDGSSGYMQDPGRMTVDPETGFITSDSNPFIAAPPEPPPFDALAYLSAQGDSSPGPIAMPPAQMPIAETPARVDPSPISMGFLPQQAAMLGSSDVMAETQSPLSFEQYMARFAPQGQPMAPMPIQQMPISDAFGMPMMLSAPQVRVPDVSAAFAPPPPPDVGYGAFPIRDPFENVVPRPVSNVDPNNPYGSPTPVANVDPKDPMGQGGAIPGGGIASLSSAPRPAVQMFGMGGAVSAPMPQMFEDPMMRLGPRLPPVGFAG